MRWLTPFFVAAVLALFIIDSLEYHHYGDHTPRRAAVLLLLLRFACTEFAVLIIPGITSVLYLVLPMRAMLHLGRKAAYTMAALNVLFFFASLWLDPRWEHGRLATVLAVLFCLACAGSISMAETASLEQESRRRAEALLEEVRRAHQQLHHYSEQIATLAATEERNRVARELHDSLGHSLTAIHLQLEKALLYFECNPQEARQALSDSRDEAHTALQEVRRSVRALRTDETLFSCVRAVALLVNQLRRNGLAVDYVVEGSEEHFSRQSRLTLYRVAQESFTNIIRHADASTVAVCLQFGEEACLRIRDDGVGFDASAWLGQQTTHRESFGLQGIQERMRLVGGTMRLESTPEQGAQLTATVSREVEAPRDAPGATLLEESEKRHIGV